MAYAADLDHQLAAEDRTKERQYVLSGTRGRWRVLGLGVVLLAAIRLAGVVPVAWSFILGFTVLFAAVNYAMTRVARSGALPPWYTLATMAVSAAMISAIVYAVGPTGHLLYVAYLIAPLQAALYLGRNEAWQTLIVNLAAFALVTGIRTSQGAPGWSWSAFLEESLVRLGAGAARAALPTPRRPPLWPRSCTPAPRTPSARSPVWRSRRAVTVRSSPGRASCSSLWWTTSTRCRAPQPRSSSARARRASSWTRSRESRVRPIYSP